MRFTKMHGLGNDYIFLNCMEGMPADPAALSRRLSHRHFGVGGDGIICVCPSRRADFRMRMFNANGSEGAMCGNGIRCFGKYVWDKGLADSAHLTIETLAGEAGKGFAVVAQEIRKLADSCAETAGHIQEVSGTVTGAVVGMGIPEVGRPIEITVKDFSRTVYPVSMGNPHGVVEVDDPAALSLGELGPLVERHPAFPHRVNAEFVRVVNRRELEMRVWERGSGETLACGTGACASVAAMASQGKLDREAVVHLAGGDLAVRWNEKTGHMFMTGPAVTVFDGETAD